MQKPFDKAQDKPCVSIVAAIGRNRELGRGNELLWHIPEDFRRFKALTLGHPVILGRKTFESILASLGKPLPERTNIVVTREPTWQAEDVVVAHSLEDALEKAENPPADGGPEEVFVIGGAQIYEQALPYVDRLYLTLIADDKEADTFFPPYEHLFTKKLSEEKREWNGLNYTWINLEK